jgi:hypothetical protein
MNLCLSKYKNEKKVWHISGWNYDIEIKNKFDAYFGKHISSWGWATWNDRYEKYEKNCEKLLKWKKNKISKFNLDNSYNFYSQIERNYTLELNTFAVFWYATIFNHNGLTLFPKLSLVKNIGFGKTATHSKSKGVFLNDKISKKNTFLLPDKMKENIIISEKVKNYFRKSKKKNYLLKILRFFK